MVAPLNYQLYRDHLGSITAITEESTGAVQERLSYDAWGKRRSASDWSSAASASLLNRGYTGHEHLDDVGLIHMNGRIYNPSLGRMLSPDPVTQAPENGQNYNRYAYANNNPMKYTDPSGYSYLSVVYDFESMGWGVGSYGGGAQSGIVGLVFQGLFGDTIGDMTSSFPDLVMSVFGFGNKCRAECQFMKNARSWCQSDVYCSQTANSRAGNRGVNRSERNIVARDLYIGIQLAQQQGDNVDEMGTAASLQKVAQRNLESTLYTIWSDIEAGNFEDFGMGRDDFAIPFGLESIGIHAVHELPLKCEDAAGACVLSSVNKSSGLILDANIYILVSHGLNPRSSVRLIAHELKHLTNGTRMLSNRRGNPRFHSPREASANQAEVDLEQYYFD